MPRVLDQDDIDSLMSEITTIVDADDGTASDHDADSGDSSKIIRFRKKGNPHTRIPYASPIIKAHLIVLNPPFDMDQSPDGRVIVHTLAEYGRLLRRRRQQSAPSSTRLLSPSLAKIK